MAISNNDNLIIRLPRELGIAYKALCKHRKISVSDDLRAYIQNSVLVSTGISQPKVIKQPDPLPQNESLLISTVPVEQKLEQKVNSALNAARLRKKKRK